MKARQASPLAILVVVGSQFGLGVLTWYILPLVSQRFVGVDGQEARLVIAIALPLMTFFFSVYASRLLNKGAK